MNHSLSPDEQAAAAALIQLALDEDLGDAGDLTSTALIDVSAQAQVQIVARQAGVLAGVPIARAALGRVDAEAHWLPRQTDGARLAPGEIVAVLEGRVRSLLTAERTILNFLTHLSGIASLTRQYVDAVAGSSARILDTRKTLPGWRLLEKYAVRAGGGTNHRIGLYDGVMIKDNHRAFWSGQGSLGDAIRTARAGVPAGIPIEVEVDTLEQLEEALAAAPDIVLLDNMEVATLRAAVLIRDQASPGVPLEASGGVTLASVAQIAGTGVERISVGALTHSAPALDLAFDWPED